jgi:hypothetical protein
VSNVTVYFEGATRGTEKSASLNIEARRAMSRFASRLGVVRAPKFVQCGGRTQTFEAAWQAFIGRDRGEIIMMLVDGEDPSAYDPQNAWQHLRQRPADLWTQLEYSNARFVFLMATCMETWVVADKGSTGAHFGSCFKAGKIPKWPSLETVHRHTIFAALQAATASCKNKYDKGRVSFQAFAELDPATVRGLCPHADYFCARLLEECA